MMKRFKPILLLIFALFTGFFFHGCKAIKELVAPDEKLSSAEMTLMELHNNQANFEWLSARFSGNVVWEGNSQSIAGTLRMRQDSAIFVSIAPVLGIEVARALITRDSVKLINRFESTYYVGDLKILASMFNADVDFFMLQALFTGNDFPHFRTDQFELISDQRLITLESKNRTRKAGGGQALQQTINVDPSNMRIRTNVIEHKLSGNALRADYRKYESIEGRLLPVDLMLMFADSSNSTSTLEMALSRTTLNVPQNMQFSVPPRYTPIRLTD